MSGSHEIMKGLSAHFRAPAIRTADYTDARRGVPAMLTICDVIPGVSRERVAVYEVTGKREARKVAQRVGAKPWNF